MSGKHWSAENGRFQLKIASRGGEVESLWDKKLHREWIWQPQENIWNNSATQLFPVVGRLIHDGIWQGEHFFALPDHGFLRYQPFFCAKKYSSGLVIEAGADAATLALWPWKWRITVSFELTDDGLIFRQQIFNEDSEAFWFSVGWHPGFALPLTEKSGWQVQFGHKAVNGPFLACDRTLVVPECASRTELFMLQDKSFSQGAIYFDNSQNQGIQVCSPEGRKVIEIETREYSWLALWGIPGANFLCIEPLAGTTDAPDFDGQVAHKRGMQLLESGQSRIFTVRLRFPLDA